MSIVLGHDHGDLTPLSPWPSPSIALMMLLPSSALGALSWAWRLNNRSWSLTP